MKDAVLITLIVTGFTVAFLHAAIPTHWLPFVVAARAQRWNLAKTLVVTGVAGSGHVLSTTALVGSKRLHFRALDKYEAMIVGAIFCLLGVVIILFEK
jgi:hypothetical protein